MLSYASRTGTRRNLAALREAGWRLMVSARGVLRHEGFRYSLDNGAWTAFQRREAFDETAFATALAKLGAGADFVVVPDVVADADGTRAMTRWWLSRCLDACPVALVAVQDGMTAAEVGPMLSARVGVFVGGSTEWKEATAPAWARLCRERGAWCHVGRVNTVRRMAICSAAGVTSVDGSSVSRFAVTLPKLDAARRQIGMML